jgi:hypothetical protein
VHSQILLQHDEARVQSWEVRPYVANVEMCMEGEKGEGGVYIGKGRLSAKIVG